MSYAKANIFYEREQWKGPVLLSVGFHGLLVVAIAAWGYVAQSHSTANDWGIKQGDAVTAQLVSASIPIPKADTVSRTPTLAANMACMLTESSVRCKETG